MAKNRIGVRIKGDKELAAKLRKLGINVQQVLEAATTAAAVVIENAAEPAAPGPNLDHVTSEKSAKRVTVQVGPDEAHWYYRFAEFGAKPHPEGKKGPLAFVGENGPIVVGSVQHPGRSRAPFLRPAVDGHREEATAASGDVLRGAVLKECDGR